MQDEAAMMRVGAQMMASLGRGDVVLLTGPLGAGKTTLVRGAVRAAGHQGGVRSPTFNLLQVFDTAPPILHADLYRLESWEGIGLEDYLADYVCFIEWAERAGGLLPANLAWHVSIEFRDSGRVVSINAPAGRELGKV